MRRGKRFGFPFLEPRNFPLFEWPRPYFGLKYRDFFNHLEKIALYWYWRRLSQLKPAPLGWWTDPCVKGCEEDVENEKRLLKRKKGLLGKVPTFPCNFFSRNYFLRLILSLFSITLSECLVMLSMLLWRSMSFRQYVRGSVVDAFSW